jgi:4-alpha-glucanotransferase
MTDDAHLAQLAKAHGIFQSYRDMQGQERVARPDTLRALLAANGIAAETASQVRESLAEYHARKKDRHCPEDVIVESRRQTTLAFRAAASWQLRCEDSDDVQASGGTTETIELPALASGVYLLQTGREQVRVIAAPARAPGVSGKATRIWGLNMALYGLRSERNLGLGDLSDLAEMTRIAGQAGADFVGINPVHARGNSNAGFSPYSPSHRGNFNTAHIAVDAIPGLQASPAARRVLSEAGAVSAALRAAPHVEYELHKATHQRLLGALYEVFLVEAPERVRAELATFRQARGDELTRFARFEALAEQFGEEWRTWPLRAEEEANPKREDFHTWLQWIADHQLERAGHAAQDNGLALGLYLDLAVGARPDGAECWCEQGTIASKVSIGAPPDHLNPEGQNWNLAAYSPRKLAAQNYRPFRRLLSATMRHAGIVRIDHVLGLHRSFWIPDDGSPGGYVRQPFAELLAILKIEAERNGTVVIGEDLGLVPQGFRKTMRDNGIHGYSVMQYERDGTGKLRRARSASKQVLSCFSTHDTPTVRGFEIGRDIDWWDRLGWIDEEQRARAETQRRKDVAELCEQCPKDDFTVTVHALLARSPAMMVTAQLDDALGHEEAQNLPGTIDEHMNWRRKYDVTIEMLPEDDRFRALANVMNEHRGKNRLQRTEEMTHDC